MAEILKHKFFRRSRASYSKGYRAVAISQWTEQHIRDLMVVRITSKSEKVPIKNESAREAKR